MDQNQSSSEMMEQAEREISQLESDLRKLVEGQTEGAQLDNSSIAVTIELPLAQQQSESENEQRRMEACVEKMSSCLKTASGLIKEFHANALELKKLQKSSLLVDRNLFFTRKEAICTQDRKSVV